ncbi:unnamed protein product [Alopecurus aequalis]
MAAALRHAARRIAGAEGAVDQVRRAGRSDAKGLAVDGEKELVGQIRKMKEEMYSLLSECQEKKMFHGDLAQHNGQLLELLSMQVQPRPNDFRWRAHRIGKRLRDCFTYAGVGSVTYVGLDMLTGPSPRGRWYKIEPALEK